MDICDTKRAETSFRPSAKYSGAGMEGFQASTSSGRINEARSDSRRAAFDLARAIEGPTLVVTRHRDTFYVCDLRPFDPATGEVANAPLEPF